MKRLLYIFPMVALLFMGCHRDIPTPDPENGNDKPEKHEVRALVLTDDEQVMNTQTNAFALDMLRRIVSNENLTAKPNICFSPVSANMALGILLNGADGQTRTEMQNVLGFTNASEEQINAYYRKLVDALPYLDETTIVKIANALWLKKTFPVKDAYKQLSQATFDATIDNVNTFVDDAVIAMINKWAADNTNNLIKEVISRDQVSEDLMMVFANALYFKGMWHDKFDKNNTRKEDFTNTAGRKEKKDMMFNVVTALYTETDDAQVLELDYKGKQYCMDILLPNESKQLGEVMAGLTAEKWTEITQSLYRWEVYTWLPKFKYKYNRSLIEDLKALGIHDAFTPNANFSRLSSVSTYLGFLNQYCYIAADEEGTEAAAVTIGGNYTTSVGPEPNPKEFRATRPFAYIIREKQYGTILFCGVVGNPE
ncbi:MAG: serpin family protein [Paludibacteraceae bacterium]|nr:serpin family protein [Paludibacteraceae bacterium]